MISTFKLSYLLFKRNVKNFKHFHLSVLLPDLSQRPCVTSQSHSSVMRKFFLLSVTQVRKRPTADLPKVLLLLCRTRPAVSPPNFTPPAAKMRARLRGEKDGKKLSRPTKEKRKPAGRQGALSGHFRTGCALHSTHTAGQIARCSPRQVKSGEATTGICSLDKAGTCTSRNARSF